MATYYYVGAQETFGIYRTKLLVGPFTTFSAAARMLDPVRKAVVDHPEYRPSRCNIKATDHNRKRPGALDLSLLNPADVIEAGRVKIRPRKPAAGQDS